MMVSIIMPAYNAEKTIRESIESVIAQTFQNWELIIINDCSTDKTKEVISDYLKDERIRYLENDVNSGVAKTRNKGLDVARFDYIAFLDSDDLWEFDKLEKQIFFMVDQNIQFSVTNYQLIDNKGVPLKKYVESKNQNYNSLLRGNKIGCLTVIINREGLKPFKFKRIGHEDYALWIKILRENDIKVHSLGINLARHRKTMNSLSSNKIKTVKWTWDIYRKEEGKNFFKTIYLMVFFAINYFSKTKKIKRVEEE